MIDSSHTYEEGCLIMMMNSKVKKAILAGLSAVVSISVLAGCGGGSGSGDKASLKGKELKVATGIYAPFAFKDENSKLVGYDLDLLDAMSKKLGFTYKVTPTEYDNMFMAVANGEYDIGMGQVCITEDRKKKMDFTEPYENAGLQFVVRKDENLTSVDQLKGKKIAVEKGTASHKYVTEHCKDSEIVVFPATEVKERKGFHFSVLKNSWLVGFSDQALLVMGPVVAVPLQHLDWYLHLQRLSRIPSL